jgi:DNA replication protein DnaC
MARPDFRPEYFNLPPGDHRLPQPFDTEYPGPGSELVVDYLYGHRPFTDLTPEHVTWLREQILKIAADRRANAVEQLNHRIPRRYRSITEDDRTTAWATTYAADPEATKSLLIVGPTGTGKTHLAWTTIKAAVTATGTTDWRAYTAADLYAHLRPHAGRDSEDAFQSVATVGLLLLDDLGAAKLTEWTEEVTYRLINHRYEQCLPGIFTSNVPPAQLREALGERIASRLTEMSDRLVLKGDDRRKAATA